MLSVIVRVNGVPSKWLYFVSCWCCQCRCLFASSFQLVICVLGTNGIHEWYVCHVAWGSLWTKLFRFWLWYEWIKRDFLRFWPIRRFKWFFKLLFSLKPFFIFLPLFSSIWMFFRSVFHCFLFSVFLPFFPLFSLFIRNFAIHFSSSFFVSFLIISVEIETLSKKLIRSGFAYENQNRNNYEYKQIRPPIKFTLHKKVLKSNFMHGFDEIKWKFWELEWPTIVGSETEHHSVESNSRFVYITSITSKLHFIWFVFSRFSFRMAHILCANINQIATFCHILK